MKWLLYCKATDDIASLKNINITEVNWKELQQMCRLLEPFYLATNDLSGSSYPTLSIVRPLLGYLIKHCVSISNSLVSIEDEYSFLIRRACNAMVLKFCDVSEKWSVTLDFPCLLDPSSRKYAFENKEQYFGKEIFAPRQEVLEEFMVTWKIHFQNSYNPEFSVKKETKRHKTGLMSRINDEIDKEKNECSAAEAKVMNWIDSDISLDDDDDKRLSLLNYWKHSKFNELSKMAKFYRTIPATSVSSEALFSKAGQTVTDLRASLKPKSVRNTLVLRDWFRNKLLNLGVFMRIIKLRKTPISLHIF